VNSRAKKEKSIMIKLNPKKKNRTKPKAKAKTYLKKYIMCPGSIKSNTDGELHYISSEELMVLYGVDPAECLVRGILNFSGVKTMDMVYLYPKPNGVYSKE